MFGATPFFLFFGMVTAIGFFYFKFFLKDTSLTWFEEEIQVKTNINIDSEKNSKIEIEL
jgi:hypothetical protein